MTRRGVICLLVAAALLALTTVAVAQQVPGASPSMGIYDTIAKQYATASQSWQMKLLGYAERLFGLLAVIEMSWAGITYLLDKDDPRSLLTAFTKKLITIGFFFTLLQNGPAWLGTIIGSFSKAGADAGGAGYISPSEVAVNGFDCAFRILDSISQLGFTDTISVGLVAGLCALVIVIAFVLVATQLLVALIESYIVTGAGVLFLGFGASRFTTDFTQKYLAYAVSVGVKLFMIYLIVGAGLAMTSQWAQMLASTSVGTNFLHNALVVTGGALMFAVVTWQVPSFAQALMSGSASLTAGAVGATAAGVMGAAVGAVAGGAMVAKGGIDATRAAAEAGQAGVGLAKAGGATGSAALAQGLVHAGGAMMAEGGRAAGSATGAMKGSAYAKDGNGASITRLGDRAAGRLQAQTEKATAANSGGSSPPPGSAPSGGSSGGGNAPGGASSPPGTPIGGAPLAGSAPDATAGGQSPGVPAAEAAGAAGSAAPAAGVDTPSVNTTAPTASTGGSTANTAAGGSPAAPLSGSATTGTAGSSAAPISDAPGGGAPAGGSAASSAVPSSAAASAQAASPASSASPASAPAAQDVGLQLPSGSPPEGGSLGSRIKSALPPRLPPDTGGGGSTINIILSHGHEG
jgi:type IV secretion system protein TrbL